MALIILPPKTVTKLADAANYFRAENMSSNDIFIKYAASEPAFDGAWGSLPARNVEIRLTDGSLWGYAPDGAEVATDESAIPA